MVYDDYIGTFSVDEGAILDAVFENFNHPTPSGFERIMIEKALLWWMSSNVKQKLVAMKRRHFSKLTKEGGGPAAIIFQNLWWQICISSCPKRLKTSCLPTTW